MKTALELSVTENKQPELFSIMVALVLLASFGCLHKGANPFSGSIGKAKSESDPKRPDSDGYEMSELEFNPPVAGLIIKLQPPTSTASPVSLQIMGTQSVFQIDLAEKELNYREGIQKGTFSDFGVTFSDLYMTIDNAKIQIFGDGVRQIVWTGGAIHKIQGVLTSIEVKKAPSESQNQEFATFFWEPSLGKSCAVTCSALASVPTPLGNQGNICQAVVPNNGSRAGMETESGGNSSVCVVVNGGPTGLQSSTYDCFCTQAVLPL